MKWVHSIRFKLLTSHVLLLTLGFAAIGCAVLAGFRGYMTDYLNHNLDRRARQIGVSLVENIEKTGFDYIGVEIEARYAPDLNDRYILIRRQDGSDIYSSRNTRGFSPELLSSLFSRSAATGQFVSAVDDIQHTKVLLVVQKYTPSTGQSYYVVVGAPETDINAALKNLLGNLILGFPLLIILSVVLGYLLVSRALKPMMQVVQSAEIITLKRLTQRLHVPQTGDEFERLAISLNRMIDRFEDAFQLNNRFTEDASHELRTSLTVMRGELETLARDGTPPADYAERMRHIWEESERLSHVVEGLLMVSRLETGEALLNKEVVDLGDLVKNTAEQMSLLSEEKHQVVSCQVADHVLAEVDPARFKQVVVNLLDNAVKYTPTGGKIKLSVYPQKRPEDDSKEQAVFEVMDTGVGIADGDIPHVFERFFRTDRARNSRTGGTGLGLSIVQSIIQAHGGSIRVISKEGEGSRFSVELPLFSESKRVGVSL